MVPCASMAAISAGVEGRKRYLVIRHGLPVLGREFPHARDQPGGVELDVGHERFVLYLQVAPPEIYMLN